MSRRLSGLPEKAARETVEQQRQRLAVQRKGAELRRPREFKASGHRRHPNLEDRCIRRHDELGLDRLLEDDVQHAVLQLDLEAVAVGERQQRMARGVERFIAFDAEFLFGEGHLASIKPLAGGSRLTLVEGGRPCGKKESVIGAFRRRRSGLSVCYWQSRSSSARSCNTRPERPALHFPYFPDTDILSPAAR